MKCTICSNEVESERNSIGLTTCMRCGFRINVPRKRGYMEYSHKTAPVLQTVSDPNDFLAFKKATDRVGQSSILRKQAPAGGRLV